MRLPLLLAFAAFPALADTLTVDFFVPSPVEINNDHVVEYSATAVSAEDSSVIVSFNGFGVYAFETPDFPAVELFVLYLWPDDWLAGWYIADITGPTLASDLSIVESATNGLSLYGDAIAAGFLPREGFSPPRPIPEPSSFGLLAAAVLFMLCKRCFSRNHLVFGSTATLARR